MSRKIGITAFIVLVAFVVTIVVAYAQPLRNSLFTHQVESNSSVIATEASVDRQTEINNDVKASNASGLALPERNGERFPATITWSRGGQPLMTFNLTNVSFASH